MNRFARPFIQQPKNQNFDGGITIVMDTYSHNAETGNRDRKTGRVAARFPSGEGVSDFWEGNRKIVLERKPSE